MKSLTGRSAAVMAVLLLPVCLLGADASANPPT